MSKVLVVDDETDLLDLVTHHLEGAGFEVVGSLRGEEGLELAHSEHPDLILLDIMLPDYNGTEILKRLRNDPRTASIPVIFLTARGEEVDRVMGLELGADDYVVKPFSLRELVLRIKARLRGAEPGSDGAEVLQQEGIRLDRRRHEVTVDKQPVALTPLEFRLLAKLMEQPGRVLSREHLLERVWGDQVYVTDRTVDTHIKRLRAKLGPHAKLVETIRGVGYRLRD